MRVHNISVLNFPLISNLLNFINPLIRNWMILILFLVPNARHWLWYRRYFTKCKVENEQRENGDQNGADNKDKSQFFVEIAFHFKAECTLKVGGREQERQTYSAHPN